jgi:hypothetical protein
MPVANRHGSANSQFLGHRGNSGQHKQTLDVRLIGSLHVVWRKDQVISRPNRIETAGLGYDRALDTFFD